ncbi:MAG: DUF4912 domain-containing protein [Pyrinomonadaceae bacterium]|nr:DUF4912 domain-containing protein [Pyrinomonadaceae bacterium]
MSKTDDNSSINKKDSKKREKESALLEFPVEDFGPGGHSSAGLLPTEEIPLIDNTEEDLLTLEDRAGRVSRDRDKGLSDSESLKTSLQKKEKDPIFKELSEPKLPDLPKENRARLQMQSPNRLYFYWSIKNNPFQTLSKALSGRTGTYTLVAKLVNRTKGIEELFPVEAEGNWWFTVDADSDYRAEIGFYAPNRPYVRIIFSNEIRTPRKRPSKRRDYTPSFNVDANQFAEVLGAAGYRRDAFEVAVAGDDEALEQKATRKTYSSLVGRKVSEFRPDEGDEIRFAMLALASGYALEDVRGEISAGLFARLESEISRFSADQVLSALKENFDIFGDEFIDEEEIGSAVFGASMVNFPRKLKKRSIPKTLMPKISDLAKLYPISSFSIK